jgi:hypothetical protein
MRQLKSLETFIDIVPLNQWGYEIRFYHSEESVVTRSKLEKSEGLRFIVGVGLPERVGLYNVIGEPFVIWRFRNPNPPSTDRLQISKIKDGVADSSEYNMRQQRTPGRSPTMQARWSPMKTSEVNSGVPANAGGSRKGPRSCGLGEAEFSRIRHGDEIIKQ